MIAIAIFTLCLIEALNLIYNIYYRKKIYEINIDQYNILRGKLKTEIRNEYNKKLEEMQNWYNDRLKKIYEEKYEKNRT